MQGSEWTKLVVKFFSLPKVVQLQPGRSPILEAKERRLGATWASVFVGGIVFKQHRGIYQTISNHRRQPFLISPHQVNIYIVPFARVIIYVRSCLYNSLAFPFLCGM